MHYSRSFALLLRLNKNMLALNQLSMSSFRTFFRALIYLLHGNKLRGYYRISSVLEPIFSKESISFTEIVEFGKSNSDLRNSAVWLLLPKVVLLNEPFGFMKYKQIKSAKKYSKALQGITNLNYLSKLLCFQTLMEKYCCLTLVDTHKTWYPLFAMHEFLLTLKRARLVASGFD